MSMLRFSARTGRRDLRRCMRRRFPSGPSDANADRRTMPAESRSPLVDHALLRIHERSEFGQHHSANGREIALALSIPVNRARFVLSQSCSVFRSSLTEVADHGIQIVFQVGEPRRSLDLNGRVKIAFRDRRGNFGDGSHLVGRLSANRLTLPVRPSTFRPLRGRWLGRPNGLLHDFRATSSPWSAK